MKKQNDLIETVITKESLQEALRQVGVGKNMILEAHVSLSSLGYVTGGARTVVDAIMDLITEGGTLLMPTQTTGNTDPSEWTNPPVLPAFWQEIRSSMPAYDPENSDLSDMGAAAENFRHRRGVICSNHPSVSFSAWGRYAKLLCNRHSVHFPLAEESPAASRLCSRADRTKIHWHPAHTDGKIWFAPPKQTANCTKPARRLRFWQQG